MGMGRPSSYTREIADRICDELVMGRSLRSICAEDWAPSPSAVFRWMEAKDGPAFADNFRERYTHARAVQAEGFVDEIADIADDGTNDYVERKRKDGTTEIAFDGEHVQRSRLRVDTRKWIASKIMPKKYGDKIEIEGDLSLTIQRVVFTNPDATPSEETPT